VTAKRDRLNVRVFGLLGAAAEGPVAIGGLVIIVVIVVGAWLR
jgi:hypothetical protein